MSLRIFYSIGVFLLVSFESINSRTLEKRQAPRFPAEELLPPPALSASFPTLRPRSPNGNVLRAEQPPRDLVPPPLKSIDSTPSAPFVSGVQNQNTFFDANGAELPLLPPLEIPPERPLTDAQITETLIGVRDTSFIPTTGQGASPSKIVDLTLSLPLPSTGLPVPVPPAPLTSNNISVGASTNNVRFPDEGKVSNVPSNCPACDCTSEVDYICASNRVLYLNSCSFDCATFCDSGLKKVPLELCSSLNSNTTE